MPALPLGFLLLPPRQLLQLLGELVDLLVAALLLGALLHLVLVRELVELELEQVGEILGHLALPPPPPPPPPLLLRHLHLVLLLGVLQQLQRALLGRQRFLRPSAPSGSPSAVFISAAAFGSASAIVLKRRIDGVEPAVHLAAQLFDLLAQLRLRER